MKLAIAPIAPIALTALTALALLSVTTAARADGAADKPADAASVTVSGVPDVDDAIQVRYPPPIVRLKLIALGLVITGGAWGVSFASGRTWATVPGADQLKIPVVGPWIALGKSGCASDDPGCSPAKVGVRAGLYVLDGIAQVAGLALIAEAIVMKTESAPSKKAAFLGLRYRGVEVAPVPLTSPSLTGLGLVGTF